MHKFSRYSAISSIMLCTVSTCFECTAKVIHVVISKLCKGELKCLTFTVSANVGAWSLATVKAMSTESAKLPRVYFDMNANGQVRMYLFYSPSASFVDFLTLLVRAPYVSIVFAIVFQHFRAHSIKSKELC